MQSFGCSVCGQLLFFDNSVCLQCGSALGFLHEERELVALMSADGAYSRSDGVPGRYRYCSNQLVARCNWLLPADDVSSLCRSCRLTSVRPNDSEVAALAAFADAESAKRRLLDQLAGLELPVIDRNENIDRGMTFKFLSSRGYKVTTGHQAGVITLDLSESDDAHREFVRQQLGEAYRTVLGHLRHEIAHYYWPLLIVDAGRLDEFRALFGDERASYQEALDRHYGVGAASTWSAATHVSQYATMHPWEDWAETFAHYLHIEAGLETANAFGVQVVDPSWSAGRRALPADAGDIGPMVGRWLALTVALNAMSRSIGQGDLYPFVLSAAVVAKLDFVHRAIASAPVR
jgi:hypothetical protein